MASLYKLVAIDSEKVFDLGKNETLIGRDPECDIILTDGYPSRRHAKIVYSDNNVILEDLNSTNGTYVNNRRVEGAVGLKEGDIVRFDTLAFYFLSTDKEDMTLLGRDLQSESAAQSSFVVIIDETPSDETAIREAFPPVAGWSSTSGADSAIEKYSHYTSQMIDQLIAGGLENYDEVCAAILVLSGNHEKRVIGLVQQSDKQNWSIGRDSSCEISLSDLSVSSQHATLLYADGEWIIRDKDSRNGTKINDKALSTGRLDDGDLLSLGNVDAVFRIKS